MALEGGQLVGAVTLGENWVHPSRWTCAIEVAPVHRRRGIGTALLNDARGLRPDVSVLAGKVRPDDLAASGFARSVGARVVQHTPGLFVAPTSPELARWCEAATHVDVNVTSLTSVSRQDLAAAFAEQYRWVHASWSPVGPGPGLGRMAAALTAQADMSLSAAAWRNGRMSALVTVLGGRDRAVEVVAETVTAEEPGGRRLLAATLAHAFAACAERGIEVAELDGHVTDPHLHPLLDGLPSIGARPLDNVELRLDRAGHSGC